MDVTHLCACIAQAVILSVSSSLDIVTVSAIGGAGQIAAEGRLRGGDAVASGAARAAKNV